MAVGIPSLGEDSDIYLFEFTKSTNFGSNRQKVPMSAKGSMAVADASESDVASLRNTVAVLSAEVGGGGT